MKLLLTISLILYLSSVESANNRTFPSGFLFGVGTSAYQTEGAWDEDGKGENIWDRWVHGSETHTKDGATGDVASDSYHHYEEDVELASLDLGASFYSFSISWSRILPTGFDNEINMKGILYYQNLIDQIIIYGMIPVATLYFNDLPQPLQDIGGWQNPEMVKYFSNYARVAFQYFDKVKYWITFNEPKSTCRFGYGEGLYAPGLSLDGTGDYECTYILLKSHAAAYHLYKDDFKPLEAKISIAIDFEWSESGSQTSEDADAVERRHMFEFGLYANPIYKGNWPKIVIDRVQWRSQKEGYLKSRLPEFNQEEIDYIKGTSDFMAVNLRSTRLVKDIEEAPYGDPSYLKDMRVETSINSYWDLAPDGSPIVPWGARMVLDYLKRNYNDPDIFITANGVADDGSSINDDVRINFYRDYLSGILDAMYEDNAKVFAYTARSLLDGFEWSEGYSQHYGFFQVDSSNPNRSRITKKSQQFYRQLTTSLRIPEGVTTTTSTTTSTTTTTTSTQTTTVSDPTTTGAANRILIYPVMISLLTSIICFLLS